MDGLSGKIAIVTGATRGIGYATAERLASFGVSVVVSSRKPDACEAVAKEFSDRGFNAFACAAHMGDDTARKRLVEAAVERFGAIDIVVANAAVNPVMSKLQTLPEEAWDKIFEVDLKAIWRLSQYALPEVAKRGQGSMVLLSSIASSVASPNSGAYAIAKAGVNHLARQLAYEWGPKGVRVNAVAPGVTRTDMIRSAVSDDAALQRVIAQTPLRRVGEPKDVADTIVFLASDMSQHITGQTIVVDGGATLRAG